MGKKKKKGGWEEGIAGDYLGVSTKSKLAKKYGVKGATGGGRALEMGGLSGSDYRDDDDVKRDIANAMANDYDVRRSLEAAGLAGNKKAAKLSANGISKYGKVEKAWDLLGKLKKEHVGGGGMFGAKNAASLTHALVNHERDTFNESIDGRIAEATEGLVKPEEDKRAWDEPREDVELSEDVQQAQSRVDDWIGSGGGGGIFNTPDDQQDASAMSPADTETDPYTKSQSYLDNYKNKLKSKGKFVSTL